MSALSIGVDFYAFLRDEGIKLPDDCSGVALSTPLDGVVEMKVTVRLTSEQVAAYGRATEKFAAATIRARDAQTTFGHGDLDPYKPR